MSAKKKRCNRAHGYVMSALELLLKVRKMDCMSDEHLPSLEIAISELITTKHLLALGAEFDRYGQGDDE